MRLISCEVTNFGSYVGLDLDFSNKGLTCIKGPTGSGKSTIPDVSAWILFGTTTKGGAVDDVVSWGAHGPTEGVAVVEVDNETMTITRMRGSAAQNDLYWTLGDNRETKHRGKDLADTQKLLNAKLHMDEDLYITSSYYHEQSEAGAFFTSNSKRRKQFIDTLVDTSFAVVLHSLSGKEKTEISKKIEEKEKDQAQLVGREQQLTKSVLKSTTAFVEWNDSQHVRLAHLTAQSESFCMKKEVNITDAQNCLRKWEESREENLQRLGSDISRLEALVTNIPKLQEELRDLRAAASNLPDSACTLCGGKIAVNEMAVVKDKIAECMHRKKEADEARSNLLALERNFARLCKEKNPYESRLTQALESENIYAARLKEENESDNPFYSTLAQYKEELAEVRTLLTTEAADIASLRTKHYDLSYIQHLCSVRRGDKVSGLVISLEHNVNKFLSTYFDSEFRVEFKSTEDNIEVSVLRNGHLCNFKQLSKGQRQLLKLCFSASTMIAASEGVGHSPNVLFFDESLDGLDNDLKLKAFFLFEFLTSKYESVFVIDHSPELHQMFDSTMTVSLMDDVSQIEYG